MSFQIKKMTSKDMANYFKSGEFERSHQIPYKHGIFQFPTSMDEIYDAGETALNWVLFDKCILRKGGIATIKDYIPYIKETSSSHVKIQGLNFKERIYNTYITEIAATVRCNGVTGELADMLYNDLVPQKTKTQLNEIYQQWLKNEDSETERKATIKIYASFYEESSRKEGTTADILILAFGSAYLCGKVGQAALPISNDIISDIVSTEEEITNHKYIRNSVGTISKTEMRRMLNIVEQIDGTTADENNALERLRNSKIVKTYERKYIVNLARHMGIQTNPQTESRELTKQIFKNVQEKFEKEDALVMSGRCLLEANGVLDRKKYDQNLKHIFETIKDDFCYGVISEHALEDFQNVCMSLSEDEVENVIPAMLLSHLKKDFTKEEHMLFFTVNSLVIMQEFEELIIEGSQIAAEGYWNRQNDGRYMRLKNQKKELEIKLETLTKTTLDAERNTEERIRNACNNKNKKIDALIHSVEQLNKTIRIKNEEIKKLQCQIEDLTKKQNEIEKTDCDKSPEKIHYKPSDFGEKKIVFVACDSESNISNIKKMFTDAVYIDSETIPLKNIKADVIVVMTKYISHALYYKISSAFPKDLLMNYHYRNAEKLCDELGKWFYQERGCTQ